jgi:hypothetical protein
MCRGEWLCDAGNEWLDEIPLRRVGSVPHCCSIGADPGNLDPRSMLSHALSAGHVFSIARFPAIHDTNRDSLFSSPVVVSSVF